LKNPDSLTDAAADTGLAKPYFVRCDVPFFIDIPEVELEFRFREQILAFPPLPTPKTPPELPEKEGPKGAWLVGPAGTIRSI
jgi:hypothetical protein